MEQHLARLLVHLLRGLGGSLTVSNQDLEGLDHLALKLDDRALPGSLVVSVVPMEVLVGTVDGDEVTVLL
jgi:hypothetical protein